MPGGKDCHPLQSKQLMLYVRLRSEGKFSLKEENNIDFE